MLNIYIKLTSVSKSTE